MSVLDDLKLPAGEFERYYRVVQPYTMVDPHRCHSLYQSIVYLLNYQIPGAFVECGVWRGGCCMLMALLAMTRGKRDRDIFLYDTFAGMVEPTQDDIRRKDQAAAHEEWQKHQTDTHNQWCYAGLEEVKKNMASTGYPTERIHYIKGKVEETIPHAGMPEKIALLRLDTDWYESTKHELEHLFPRLVPGGVIILDDYYFWQGQQKAVDEYFAKHKASITFRHVTTGVMGIRPDGVHTKQ